MVVHADSPSVFDGLSAVFLSLGGKRPKRFTVRSWRPHKDRVLIRFNGIEGRDEAEAWKGAEVLARKADLPEPGEGEVYLHQLTGLVVRLEDGSLLGTVRDFIETPGQETWSIETPDGREVLLPVTEEFVLSVDLDQGEVLVSPPEGLLDIYLGEG